MPKRPTVEIVKELKTRYVAAFRAWLVVPGQIFGAGAAAGVTSRPEMCGLLERKWKKLYQDISGTLTLIATNHIGPAAALSRVCRETAMRMVVWSFSEPVLDRAHLHVEHDIRQRKNAKRLLRDAKRLVQIGQHKFKPVALNILNTAIQTATDLQKAPDEWPCSVVPPEALDRGFAALTQNGVDRMLEAGLDPSVLAPQLVDFWLECEAVHTGEGAMHLYEPEEYGEGLEMNGEITCLAA